MRKHLFFFLAFSCVLPGLSGVRAEVKDDEKMIDQMIAEQKQLAKEIQHLMKGGGNEASGTGPDRRLEDRLARAREFITDKWQPIGDKILVIFNRINRECGNVFSDGENKRR